MQIPRPASSVKWTHAANKPKTLDMISDPEGSDYVTAELERWGVGLSNARSIACTPTTSPFDTKLIDPACTFHRIGGSTIAKNSSKVQAFRIPLPGCSTRLQLTCSECGQKSEARIACTCYGSGRSTVLWVFRGLRPRYRHVVMSQGSIPLQPLQSDRALMKYR